MIIECGTWIRKNIWRNRRRMKSLRRRFSEIKEKFRDLSVAARGLSVAVAQYAALEITRSQLLAAKDALDKTINQPAKED